jgi:outer membrane protein assembly factor BamB
MKIFPCVLLILLLAGTTILASCTTFTRALGQTPQIAPAHAGLPAAVDWWPMFHHDLLHTGYSISTAPQTNQTVWRYTTGGSVMSSPAVVNGTVYVGSNDDNVYALNASTGARIWSYATSAQVFSSPAVDGGVVYVGSVDDSVYALNATTGAYLWSYRTGGAIQSSPAVAYGLVYVGSSDNNIYALNTSDGRVVWNYTTGWWVTSSPAVAEGRVYIGSWDLSVYAFDALNGSLLWNVRIGCEGSSPAVVNGTVYIGSADGNVYALNASTGTNIWAYPTGLWVQSSPAVTNGIVYVGSSDNETYALNAATGTLVWSFKTQGYVFSSPAVAGGLAYVGSDDGSFYALDAGNGALVWKCTGLDWVESSPVVVDGSVYVGTDAGSIFDFGQSPSFPSVSILPRFVVMDVGQSQLFTSMVNGGTGPYTFQWCQNDTAVQGATLGYWTFTPNNSGSYLIYLNVTDNVGNMAESNKVLTTVNQPSTTFHDVAVTGMTIPFNEAYQGWIINVSVTVANFGDATESFTTTLEYDNNTIGSQPVSNLAPSATQTLLFSWNTTNVPYSYVHNYTITAIASTVPSETNMTNNQLTDGPVQIRIMGDANGDGVVDMKDVATAVAAFNSFQGRSRWNLFADLNLDGRVDMKDIVAIVLNFKHS